MPEASIIITSHDRPHFLVRAIESARAATQDEVEIVVIDDASSDETAHVCKGIPYIKYHRVARNQGVAGARNIGILASRGDYLSFLDDDDLRLSGSLDSQIRALSIRPAAGLIYGQAIFGNQDGSIGEDSYPTLGPQGDVFWQLLAQNFIPCGTVVFRRSCLYRVGLLDESIPGIDDWDLWIRIAEVYEVVKQDQPVLIWRKSSPVSKQGSSRAAEMVKLSVHQLHNRWLALPRATKSSATMRRKSLISFSNNMASHLLWESWRALAAGQFVNAQKNILMALKFCPAGVTRVMFRPASLRFLLSRAPREWQAIRADLHSFKESPGGSS